jgi:hypothetical protein
MATTCSENKVDNLSRQYKHSLKVDSVQTSQAANQAQVEATINEVAQLYEDGQLNQVLLKPASPI